MNAPVDMSRFIEAKSDQIGADDLIGGPRTFTVRGVTANDGEQPVNVWLEGEERVFRPCKTIRRVMVAMWGADANQYVGRAMTLYRDAEVQFGGMKVGGIRISHMSHIDSARDVVVMKSKGKKAGMRILPLPTNTRPPAANPPADDGGSTSSAGAGAAPTGELPAAVQEWVDGVIGRIRTCETITDLAELQAAAKVETKLARYPKQRDDLVALFNDRRAVIEGAGE
jgi:hypothetical protein